MTIVAMITLASSVRNETATSFFCLGPSTPINSKTNKYIDEKEGSVSRVEAVRPGHRHERKMSKLTLSDRNREETLILGLYREANLRIRGVHHREVASVILLDAAIAELHVALRQTCQDGLARR